MQFLSRAMFGTSDTEQATKKEFDRKRESKYV